MKDLFENIGLPVEKKLELLQNLLKQVQQSQNRGAEVPVTIASERLDEPAAEIEAAPIEQPVAAQPPVDIEERIKAAPESVPLEIEPPYQDEVPFDNSNPVIDENIELSIQSPADMAAEATKEFEESRQADESYEPAEQPKAVAFDVPDELKDMEVVSTSEILQEQMLKAQATVENPLPEEGPVEKAAKEGQGLIKEEMGRDEAFKAFAAAEGIEAPATPKTEPVSMGGEEFKKDEPLHESAGAPVGGGLITDAMSDEEAFKAFAAADKPAPSTEKAPVIEETPVIETPDEAQPEIAMSDFFSDGDDEAPAEVETAQAAPDAEEKVMTIGDFFADDSEEEEAEEPGTLGDFFSGMD